MKQNDIYDVTIVDVDNNGNGIAKINDFVVFIKGAILNEKVTIKIINIEKHFANGEILNKTNELCPYYYKCGGCNFLHLSYKEELEQKEMAIKNLFKYYKVNDIESVNEVNYRNKVVFHVENGKLGFYNNNSHNLIEIDNCLLLSNGINKIIPLLKNFNLCNITKIMIRETYYTKEIMIAFYGNITEEINNLKNTNVKSIYLNNELIFGNPYLIEIIDNKKYCIGVNSFFQVNTLCMEVLYKKIKEEAKVFESLLDLYCGTGTIGIYLSDNFKSVLGVEEIPSAIDDANNNSKINNLKNVSFKCLDVNNIKETNFTCCVVDPPRSGLTKNVINKLFKINLEKIIYVSCNPLTLKRDLELLKTNYNIISITPFNMFPKTNHVECVVVLNK